MTKIHCLQSMIFINALFSSILPLHDEGREQIAVRQLRVVVGDTDACVCDSLCRVRYAYR